jgi:CO/xanthine dehydrogenase FAD-binding subunit
MKLPGFDYHRPNTVRQAIAVLAERGPDAAPLAGGQSLVPMLALRDRRPTAIVDLNGVAGLAEVALSSGVLAIGAMTRQRRVELDPTITAVCPLIAAAAGRTGHVSVRNRGTIGGSIAHGDAAAELPTAAVALGARLVLTGPDGERTAPMAGWSRSALRVGELVTAVRIPLPANRTRSAFRELSHPAGSRPVVCVAAVVTFDRDGGALGARVAVSGRGAPPVLVEVTATLADGTAPEVVADGMRFVESNTEHNGPDQDYCRAAARSLARDALADAIGGRR